MILYTRPITANPLTFVLQLDVKLKESQEVVDV
jgi:hypothetical protein